MRNLYADLLMLRFLR